MAIYLAGGLEHPLAPKAQQTFWRLDLERLDEGWKSLEPWPGPERMLATAAALDGSFYLLSGASLHQGPDGEPVRSWLRDGYRFTPGRGWSRIADLPRAAVAAPSPAMTFDRTKLLIVGGDDGRQVDSPPGRHQGFPRGGLFYDVAKDAWTETEEAPFAFVATPGCFWEDGYVVPGGETRPGVRSTEVWVGRIRPPR
jgi:N-acetylneuraminic acid mutarotase